MNKHLKQQFESSLTLATAAILHLLSALELENDLVETSSPIVREQTDESLKLLKIILNIIKIVSVRLTCVLHNSVEDGSDQMTSTDANDSRKVTNLTNIQSTTCIQDPHTPCCLHVDWKDCHYNRLAAQRMQFLPTLETQTMLLEAHPSTAHSEPRTDSWKIHTSMFQQCFDSTEMAECLKLPHHVYWSNYQDYVSVDNMYDDEKASSIALAHYNQACSEYVHERLHASNQRDLEQQLFVDDRPCRWCHHHFLQPVSHTLEVTNPEDRDDDEETSCTLILIKRSESLEKISVYDSQNEHIMQ